jgi:chromosome segregation ATPase
LPLLEFAQSLTTEIRFARNKLSTLESRKIQADHEILMLESKTKEQKAMEAESLAKLAHLRGEAPEAETMAAKHHQRAIELEKEVDDKRRDHDSCQREIATVGETLTERTTQLQSTKKKMKIE